MPKGTKEATTFDKQIEILKSRGCVISDDSFCKRKLEELNYYRLTAYFLPFRQNDGNYLEGTSFHQVYRIYEFDRKLRSIIFSAVEEIEVYLRSEFAYFHAHKYGPVGYLDASNFPDRMRFETMKESIDREIRNNKNVLFVKHHQSIYGGIFPIWAITELFTFGMLSKFYNNLPTQDKKHLSKKLYGTSYSNLSSWLRCCTDLRNICAHYGRLYYRIFTATPKGFPLREAENCRLWGEMMVVRALHPDSGKWNNSIIPSLDALFEEYKEEIDLYHLAFPVNWSVQLFK